jgi:hypothetical protein
MVTASSEIFFHNDRNRATLLPVSSNAYETHFITEVEIFSLAHMLNIDILIYTYFPISNEFKWLRRCSNFCDERREMVFLNHLII